MKNILILISAIALGTSGATPKAFGVDPNRPHRKDDYEHEQEQEKKQKYTCPMHPEVVMDHPGNCPKCGMKLIPLKSKRPTACPKRKPNGSNAQAPTPNAEHSSHEMHGEHAMHAMPQSDQHAMSMQSSI